MTRDYKHTIRHDRDRPLPGWIWLLTGLAMGLAVALIVYLNQPRPTPMAPQAVSEGSARASNETASSAPKKTPAERRFDFYTLLPELEVVVPEAKPRASPAGGNTPAPAQVTSATGPYVLQAGSFRRAQEADSLKANLALLGVEADIQTVTVDDSVWHRVRIGPYAELAELSEVRDRLQRNQIDTVLLKERQ
ncbi:MAG: SPOR domain-containing protein [Gammaproteobacteria bacterium]